MSNGTVSLTPIIEAIDDVLDQIDHFDSGGDPRTEREKVRVQNVLEAVQRLIRAHCDPTSAPPHAPDMLKPQPPPSNP